MLRFVKQVVCLAGAIISCQSAFGFALMGPVPATGTPDSFEVPDIGYDGGLFSETPKQVKSEYRRNTPVIYWAFDNNFDGYFSTNGEKALDQAMAIFNSLTNVSSYSDDLTEFPLDSRRVNFRAASANLLDLKSAAMALVAEQVGLFEPSRWVWALHARAHLTGTGIPPCPGGMIYTVFQLNYAVTPMGVDLPPTTSYVNGVLYTYLIFESCTTTPEPEADAVEIPVDPLSSPYSAVADAFSLFYAGLQPGGFYTSLTRDDIAGLRYLIRTNNLNNEASGFRTTEFATNNTTAAIQTLDLHLFADQARTNNAAALAALYPGLIITSSTNSFGLLVTTNITETLVNNPLDPAGTPPSHPFFSTNYTTNLFTFFQHTFGNLVTNTFATRGLVGAITIGLTNSPFAPAGTPATIVTNVKPSFVNGVFGDFFILPTNFCSAQILSNLLTQVTSTTNPPTITVPAGGATNAVTFTPGSVNFFTNHFVVYVGVTCDVDSVAIRGGVDRIIFIKREYDGITSQIWDPVTNDYVLPELQVGPNTNKVILRHMQRRVPRPDILFTCADLATVNNLTYTNTVDGLTETLSFALGGVGEFIELHTMQFNAPNVGSEAGPGTIESPNALPTLIIFNQVSPLFGNGSSLLSTNAFFVNEQIQVPLTAWGSFDGTTNAPIVYPNSATLNDVESHITGPQSSTPSLPTAAIGVNYSAQLTAVGGQAPYTWSLAPASPGLPGGLNISSNGKITGVPAGPESIYDFIVRITDQLGATKDVQYTITVF